MRTVYQLFQLNQFGEAIDSYGKEFETYEEAKQFLDSNPLMFDQKYETWEVFECVRKPATVGMRWR